MEIRSLELIRLRIPFRTRFEHRSASRGETNNLIARLTLENGIEGWGEGVPREYVTGETVEASSRVIRERYGPRVIGSAAGGFEDAVHLAGSLPVIEEGGVVYNAARSSVELAVLDAFGRHFRKRMCEAGSVPPPPGYFPGGISPAVTAPLPAGRPLKVRAMYSWFRALGFRSFKIKVGLADDERRFGFLLARAPALSKRGIGIQADANEAWTLDEARERMRSLLGSGVAAVEQPLPKGDWIGFGTLAAEFGRDAVILDESVRTVAEARRAAECGLCGGVLVRLSKCGGFLPSLEVARILCDHKVRIYLGAMVGETGILAAAQRHFLEAVPFIASLQPPFNASLLAADPVKKRFRRRSPARIRSLDQDCPGSGLGVKIDLGIISRFGERLFRLEA